MNRRWDELLPLEDAILAVALERQEPFYAYAMAGELQDRGATTMLASNGTMYKALRRMMANGLLTSYYEDPTKAEADGRRPRRTFYEVTPKGEVAYRDAPRAVVRGAVEPALRTVRAPATASVVPETRKPARSQRSQR